MEMTLHEATNSIFTMLETAIYNYEIDVMVEAEGSADNPEEAAAKKASKLKTVIDLAKKALFKVWDMICKAFDALLLKLNKWRGPVKIEEDLAIYPATTKFDSKLVMYAETLAKGDFSRVDEIKSYIDGFDKTVVLKAGQTVMNKSFEGVGAKYKAAADKIASAIPSYFKVNENDKTATEKLTLAKTVMQRVANILNSIIKDIAKINSWHDGQYAAEIAEMIGKKREKREAKADKEFAKENAKAHNAAIKDRVNNESTDYTELTDKILAESVRLLSECDNAVTDDTFQKSVDEIKEETPSVDDEYPADDVTGGEGEKDDDAIKELLDNDKEALKVATENDGSAITESVIIRF